MATSAQAIRRMFAEQAAQDDALAAAGFAPGEEPSPEFLAEALPERQTVFTGEAYEPYVDEPKPFVDPFTEAFVDPFTQDYGFVDPFTEEYDTQVLANPLADLQSDFPMEPGTSRASREMGEMFVPSEIPIPGTDIGIPTGGGAELVGPGRTTPATGGGVGAELTAGLPITDPAFQKAHWDLSLAKKGGDPAEIEKAEEAVAAFGTGEPLGEAGKYGLSAAALTMTDPEEIAGMLRQFPEIGISYAPDGAIIATNSKTKAQGLINRPGMSGMDALQMLGIVTAFHPAAKFASLGVKTAMPGLMTKTMRKAMEKEATKQSVRQGAAAMAATQAVIEGGQELAGGTFDPEDIVFTGVAGAAGERIAKPLANLAGKAKELVGKVGAVVPRSVSQALIYAQATGRKVFTSDALGEFMTPVQQIAMKVIERIPVTGIGRQRIKQKAARTDALIELVNKYGINIEKELGEDIATNFITRMIKQRFWGKNADKLDPNKWPSPITKPYEHRQAKQQAQELIDRAWKKESVVAIDAGLAKALARGDLDDEIVERILDQAKPKRVTDLFEKLMPEGKRAVKQRFLTKALEKAGWTPDAPQIADPDGFVKFISNPKNRKVMNIFFDKTERELIEGTTEYLRMTSAAAKTSKGAGMVAAVGGTAIVGGILLSGLFGYAALTAGAGRIIQSAPVRNLLLKLTYAKGNPALAQKIMQQLRPLVLAMENTYFESGGPPTMPDVEFNKDMMKGLGDYSMEYLRSLGETGMEKFEDVTARLSEMLTE